MRSTLSTFTKESFKREVEKELALGETEACRLSKIIYFKLRSEVLG
jgi:hypothetical protein